ncbi:MAG TPA: hypothetical protein VJN95_01790 [Gemmatimonadales bacterium]|nr:hypothetical protein [Gemmatimonadales bacterium]
MKCFRRLVLCVFALAIFAPGLAAQLPDQSFEMTTTPDSATVGDTVTIHFRLRMGERDLLFDTIPVPVGQRHDGVEIFSIGRLTRDSNRVFQGEAKVAFYRPGKQEVPPFGVAFARVVAAIERAVLRTAPASLEIVSTLPAGDQPLKDIRPLVQTPAPRWPWIAIPVIAALTFWLTRKIRARRPRIVESATAPSAAGPSPLDQALQQLERIEREGWAARGELPRHYEAVANVVRDYLVVAEATPARELTTRELIGALAHRGDRTDLTACRQFLEDADQVKFAAASRPTDAAGQFLGSARQLLGGWHSRHNGNGHAAG